MLAVRGLQVLASSEDRESVMPYIEVFKTLIRRRPFLIRALENTLVKLILSLEFYSQDGRKKIAMGELHCPSGSMARSI